MSASSVSCVIPVFNGERFLAQAIESVLAQSYPVVEIIVVDDGSTDRSADVARSFGREVRCVTESRRGQVATRNHGIRLATGDYIALLDADDLWEPVKIERQVAHFTTTPGLGACLTHQQNFWMAEVAGELTAGVDARLTAPHPGAASTLMARRALFAEVGPLDESIQHRDIQDWMIRIETAGWVSATLEPVLVRRRIHDSNVSRNRDGRGENELLRLAQQALLRRRSRSG
jgi:glycosyltransferase involved in cell wall biosynthesis